MSSNSCKMLRAELVSLGVNYILKPPPSSLYKILLHFGQSDTIVPIFCNDCDGDGVTKLWTSCIPRHGGA